MCEAGCQRPGLLPSPICLPACRVLKNPFGNYDFTEYDIPLYLLALISWPSLVRSLIYFVLQDTGSISRRGNIGRWKGGRRLPPPPSLPPAHVPGCPVRQAVPRRCAPCRIRSDAVRGGVGASEHSDSQTGCGPGALGLASLSGPS